MKKLIFTLLFSTLVFSSPSYAGWTEVSKNVKGNTFYVDFDRIRKHGGYVYFWELGDYLMKPLEGYLSSNTYKQGDCKLFRFKILSISMYTEPMSRGTPSISFEPNKGWKYPPPNSPARSILKKVCSK